MSKPKVSICIPAYKQTEYLRKTLDSILIQDFTDYEVIITDDSPGDTVKNLVDEYTFGDRLTYYKNRELLGSPANWNRAISQASGEYIKIMHHDDWFTFPYSLQKFVNVFEKTKNVAFVVCDTNVFSKNSRLCRTHKISHENLKNIHAEPVVLLMGNLIGAPTRTMHKKLSLIYDERLKWYVDIDYYIHYLLDGGKFHYIGEPLITTGLEGDEKVTNVYSKDNSLILSELLYLYDKVKYHIPKKKRALYIHHLRKKMIAHNFLNTELAYSEVFLDLLPNNLKRYWVLAKYSKRVADIVFKILYRS